MSLVAVRLLVFFCLLLLPARGSAQTLPDWIGTWSGNERVFIWEKPAPRLVYTSHVASKNAGGPLPDFVQATVRLPGGIWSAKFQPKSWKERVEVPLQRTVFSREGPTLDSMNPHGGSAAEIDREWNGPLGGDNVSLFRLLPNPQKAPLFKVNPVYVSRAVGQNLGSLAPTVRIQGSNLIFDARAYEDEVGVTTDVAVIADLPQGHAFGLVLGARIGKKPLVIPLHLLDKTPSKTPFCVVSTGGNFDYSPDSMAGSSVFGFKLKAQPPQFKR